MCIHGALGRAVRPHVYHVGRTSRAGVTLLELMVVLVLLAMLAGVVGLTFRAAHPAPRVAAITAIIAAARDSAVHTGRAVTIHVPTFAGPRDATAYPDGRIIADTSLGVNPLTGAMLSAKTP